MISDETKYYYDTKNEEVKKGDFRISSYNSEGIFMNKWRNAFSIFVKCGVFSKSFSNFVQDSGYTQDCIITNIKKYASICSEQEKELYQKRLLLDFNHQKRRDGYYYHVCVKCEWTDNKILPFARENNISLYLFYKYAYEYAAENDVDVSIKSINSNVEFVFPLFERLQRLNDKDEIISFFKSFNYLKLHVDSYIDYIKYCYSDDRLQEIKSSILEKIDLYNTYCEIIKKDNDRLKNKLMGNAVALAVNWVTTIIDEELTVGDFLSRYNVDKILFKKNIKVLKNSDSELYELYLSCLEKNEEKKKLIIKTVITAMLCQLKNGACDSNMCLRKFDVLDYYLLVNKFGLSYNQIHDVLVKCFSGDDCRLLSVFCSKAMPNKGDILSNFDYDLKYTNMFLESNFICLCAYDENGVLVQNGVLRSLSLEEKIAVIEYLKQRDIIIYTTTIQATINRLYSFCKDENRYVKKRVKD